MLENVKWAKNKKLLIVIAYSVSKNLMKLLHVRNHLISVMLAVTENSEPSKWLKDLIVMSLNVAVLRLTSVG